jgi:cell division protein ZapB
LVWAAGAEHARFEGFLNSIVKGMNLLNDLLTKLETKTQALLDNVEILELENTELKEELESLKNERIEWESKLTAIIDKLGSLDEEQGEPVTEEASWQEPSAQY